MPTYEMPLLVRLMTKPDLKNTLKRTAECIFQKGGFIRKIENLGKKETPYRMSSHGRMHTEANFFIFFFDLPPSALASLRDDFNRDIDIIRNSQIKQEEIKNNACTIYEENLPPAYRPSVQKLISISKSQEKRVSKSKFQYNTGLSHYPFQK